MFGADIRDNSMYFLTVSRFQLLGSSSNCFDSVGGFPFSSAGPSTATVLSSAYFCMKTCFMSSHSYTCCNAAMAWLNSGFDPIIVLNIPECASIIFTATECGMPSPLRNE